jgi:cell division septation protein DedD
VLDARHELRFGRREVWIVSFAALAVLALTFALGVLVGRELGPEVGGEARTETASRGAGGRERGPRASKAEGPVATEERLTFYQTLTAPTPSLPVLGPPKVEERMVRDEPAPSQPARPERRSEAGARTAARAVPGEPREASRAGAAEAQLWTVQVSSFRSKALAEELRGRLLAQGLDAYLVSSSTEEGRVRHRVRVGAFATRAEAERVAADLRSERTLNPFVTTRAR